MTRKEAVALLERYSNYDGMGIPNLAGCKEAMKVAVTALKEAYPELAESEDERIRRTLVEYFGPEAQLDFIRGVPIQKIRDWLEKQKEEEGYEAIPVESTLEYKLGFKAGKESEKQKEQNLELYYDKELDNAAREFYLSGGAYSPVDSTGLVPIVRMAEFGATWMKERMEKEQKPIIQDVELNDAVYDYVRDHFIAGADFTPEYIKKLMENAFFAGVDYYLLKQVSESCESDTNVEKVIEDVIRVYGKTQGEWVGGYNVDTLIVNLRRAFNKKEQKPADLPAGFYVTLPDGKKYYAKEMRCNGMNVKVVEPKPAEYADDVVEEAEEYTSKVDCGEYGVAVTEAYIAGVLSERNRKPAEWSEEDEKMLKCCLIAINHYEKTCNIGDHLPTKFNIDGYLASVDKVKSWLKSLRPQSKQEWSEEDEKKAAEDYADEFPGMTHENDGSTIEDYDKPYNDFLAGVLWAKHRGIFQNGNTHWKPSEQQMKALESCGQCNKQVYSLYLDLKKL